MTGLISEIPGHQKSLTLIFLLGIIKMGLTNSHLTKYFPVLRECILVLNDTLSFSLVKLKKTKVALLKRFFFFLVLCCCLVKRSFLIM